MTTNLKSALAELERLEAAARAVDADIGELRQAEQEVLAVVDAARGARDR